MYAAFGKPGAIRQAPDALLAVCTNRVENDNTLGPQSHGVGPCSEGWLQLEKISSSEYAIDRRLSRFTWMPRQRSGPRATWSSASSILGRSWSYAASLRRMSTKPGALHPLIRR